MTKVPCVLTVPHQHPAGVLGPKKKKKLTLLIVWDDQGMEEQEKRSSCIVPMA
jgi:hypothetical protein